MRKIEEFFENYNICFLLPLVALYFYTRIKYLGETSYYMHINELQTAYGSMSLAHFGTESLISKPTLLMCLGGLLFKIKGGLFSLKLFRMISVAGGFMCMVFSYLVVSVVTGSKKQAYLEALLITILPVFFISQRTGVNDYLFLEIIPAAFYFLLIGMKYNKRVLFALSGLLWGLILFSSAYSYIIIPVFLIITAIYLLHLKKINKIDAIFLFAIPSAILVILLSTGYRMTELNPKNILSNLIHIKNLLWDDLHPYNSSSMFGSIYIFSIPVLIIGMIISLGKMIRSIKERTYEFSFVIWLYIIIALFCDLLTENADIQTGCSLFFAISLLITEGLVYISDNLKCSYIIEVLLYLSIFGIFTYYYYVNYNSAVNNSVDHEQGIVIDKSVGEAIKSTVRLLPDKNICIISDNFDERNLMIALFGNASPSEYMAFKDQDSFSFGNIRVGFDDEYDTSGNTVYIINDTEYKDIIDLLTSQGWGNAYLKEYTVCYISN